MGLAATTSDGTQPGMPVSFGRAFEKGVTLGAFGDRVL